jgi:hypothetical protein
VFLSDYVYVATASFHNLNGVIAQNNMHELWSLLNYLYPEYFKDPEPFDEVRILMIAPVRFFAADPIDPPPM